MGDYKSANELCIGDSQQKGCMEKKETENGNGRRNAETEGGRKWKRKKN